MGVWSSCIGCFQPHSSCLQPLSLLFSEPAVPFLLPSSFCQVLLSLWNSAQESPPPGSPPQTPVWRAVSLDFCSSFLSQDTLLLVKIVCLYIYSPHQPVSLPGGRRSSVLNNFFPSTTGTVPDNKRTPSVGARFTQHRVL